MGNFEIPGLIIAIVIFFVIGFLGARQVPAQFQTQYYYGMLVRLLGVFGYHFVVFGLYNGAADPVVYYRWGIKYADYFSQFDMSPLFDVSLWRNPRFVGTNFMGYPAAFMIMLVGQSYRGTWLLFSSLSFFGLIFIAKAFYRAYGIVDYKKYLTLVLLLPPLWFWTASLSKDTWVIFGVGLFMLGFIQKNKKQSIVGMAAGIFFCYLVRPQIAAILAFALAGSYFLISFKKLTFKNVIVLIFATAGAFYFLGTLDVGSGVGDIEEFAVSQRQYSSYGGSTIQQSTGVMAYVMAPINILLRPFPWEVGSFLQVITFFELYFIWMLAFLNRRSVIRAFKFMRKDRLVAFSFVFIALFSVGAGMALSNLGLIARQRIILYPFMLIIIYAYSDNRLNFMRRKRMAKIRAKQNG